MVRPTDTYAHAQFEDIDSNNLNPTVQCRHCRNWQGSASTLHRKKDHLQRCANYLAWRADGNGQDLAPPNKYERKRHSVMTFDTDGLDDTSFDSSQQSQLESSGFGGDSNRSHPGSFQQYTPSQKQGTVPERRDLQKFFDELWEQSGAEQGVRVRCKACGYTRSKNINFQRDHLRSCKDFLDTPEGSLAAANGILDREERGNGPTPKHGDIYAGRSPNPNLTARHRPSQTGQIVGQKSSRSVPRNIRHYTPSKGAMAPLEPPRAQPSLVDHLCSKFSDQLTKASQASFLSHAGCGTLSRTALTHWLGQNIHITRGLVSLIGSLITKVRLHEVVNTKVSTQHRALDLLISAVSNLRKEFDFIINTKQKYRLSSKEEQPTPVTKSILDLLGSCASAECSLVEGMVVLWAIEHCYCMSWQYASTMATNTQPDSNTVYSIPSYLNTSETIDIYATGLSHAAPHNKAIQQSLIPNWSSREFNQFVDACKAIVDELANAQTSGSGREELARCEMQHNQVLYLWERMWPEVDGMAEETEISTTNGNTGSSNSMPQQKDARGAPASAGATAIDRGRPITIDDDEDGDDLGEDAALESL